MGGISGGRVSLFEFLKMRSLRLEILSVGATAVLGACLWACDSPERDPTGDDDDADADDDTGDDDTGDDDSSEADDDTGDDDSSEADDDTGEVELNTDPSWYTDGAWIDQSLPDTEPLWTKALFIEDTWVFGRDPLAAIRLVDSAWQTAPMPEGGAVVAAASFEDLGVVVMQDGSVRRWDGNGWPLYTNWVASPEVVEIAVGSEGELYVGGSLGVVSQDSETVYESVGVWDIWASPDGGAFVSSGDTLVSLDSNTSPTTVQDIDDLPDYDGGWTPEFQAATVHAVTGTASDDLWTYNEASYACPQSDHINYAGHFDGTSWAWLDVGGVIGIPDFCTTGLWQTPSNAIVLSQDCRHCVGAPPVHPTQWKCHDYVGLKILGANFYESLSCSTGFDRDDEGDEHTCSFHAQGDAALILSDHQVLAWEP